MANPDDRLYDVVGPRVARQPRRARTVNYPPNSAFTNYAVPRSVKPPSPPPPRAIPPAVPPRNKTNGEGDTFSSSLPNTYVTGSPSDRMGLMSPIRNRTTSSSSQPANPAILSKSPSVVSVSSSHSASEELSLNEFMLKYSKNLPLKVKVCKGFFGVSEETAINTGDVFKLHFMKHSKVAIIDTQDDMRFSVPLSSYLKFALLYNPNDNLEEARKGFMFETAGELLSCKVLPKVVMATRSFQGGTPESSVAQDELLVIKNTKSKGKHLKVFSVTAGKSKSLGENCAGHFSTNPEDVEMHLFEITVHAHDVMPCNTLLMVRGRETGVLAELDNTVVTLRQTVIESSVIATSGLDEEGESSDVAEMPADLDIEVEAVPLDEYELERLRHDTKYMYELFDPFSVTLYMTKSSKRVYDIQCELYKAINTELTGLEIMRPHAITQGTKTTAAKSNGPYQPLTLNRQSDEKCTDYYVVMTSNRIVSSEHDSDVSGESNASENLSLLEQHNTRVEDRLGRTVEELHSLRAEVAKLQTFTEHLRNRCDSLQAQMRMMGSEKMTNGIDSRGPASLPGEANYSLLGGSGSTNGRSPSPAEQRSAVAQLDHLQVLNLLESIGMKQYTAKFQEEHIDGEALAELDDEMMRSDLGISSKFHRTRLMKVITGQHSAAKNILKGEDPYAHKKQDSPSPQPSI